MHTILGNIFNQLAPLPLTSKEEAYQKNAYVKGMLETFINIKAMGIKWTG